MYVNSVTLALLDQFARDFFLILGKQDPDPEQLAYRGLLVFVEAKGFQSKLDAF